MRPDREAFQRSGVACLDDAIPDVALTRISQSIDKLLSVKEKPAEPPTGLTSALPALGRLASQLEGEPMRAVRLLVFKRAEDHNWAAGWRQERVLAMTRMGQFPGRQRWSSNEEGLAGEPADEIRRRMVSFRLYLDEAAPDAPPLLTLAGSHRLELAEKEEEILLVESGLVEEWRAGPGDIVALKAETVHAGRRAAAKGPSRLLHIDFAPENAPSGLDWVLDMPKPAPWGESK